MFPLTHLGMLMAILAEFALVLATSENNHGRGLEGPGACARSIFDTRLPNFELSPDEARERLNMSPARHPSKNVCASYAGRDSCCSEKTLKDLAAWSEAIDASRFLQRYFGYQIERDPGSIVDNIIITVRAIGNPYEVAAIDWKAIRARFREPAGKILQDFWKAVNPSVQKAWSEYITYQEGLLCSACEPNFGRFLDGSNIKLQPNTASSVADAYVEVIRAIDAFFTNPDEQKRITAIVYDICVFSGSQTCESIPVAFSFVYSYVTGMQLRSMICAAQGNSVGERDESCKQFLLNKVLRGLFFDVSLIFGNIFDYIYAQCMAGPMPSACTQIQISKKNFVEASSFSFDERPLATNVYTNDGFDILTVACKSNLSGYACGKSGPEPGSNKDDDQQSGGGCSAAPVIITIVILLILGGLGAVLYASRGRIKQITQSWYHRMRDVDDNNGPMVGLV